MKKNGLTLVLIAALAVAAYFALKKNEETGSLGQFHNDYHIEDTASVTKVFLSNKNGEKILLERESVGAWRLNDTYYASQPSIEILLKTINRSRIKSTVPKAMHNDIVRQLASNATKVEVYTKRSKDKPKLVYYVGKPAKDFKGTFMVAERNGQMADKPFIVEIPGFDGYLSIRYHTNENDWRDRKVFTEKVKDIKQLTVDYPRNPEHSFVISRAKSEFELSPMHESSAPGMLPENLNQDRIQSYLSEFNSKYAEAIDNQHVHRDSIGLTIPFAVYQLEFMDGTSSETSIYYMPIHNRSRVFEDNQGNTLAVDVEHYFGLMNNNEDFVILQHAVFGELFRVYEDFFMKAGEKLES